MEKEREKVFSYFNLSLDLNSSPSRSPQDGNVAPN